MAINRICSLTLLFLVVGADVIRKEVSPKALETVAQAGDASEFVKNEEAKDTKAKAAGASLLQSEPSSAGGPGEMSADDDGGEDGEATLLQGNVAGEEGESVSADQSLEEDDAEGDDDDDDDEEGDDDDDDDEDEGAEGASATETEEAKDTKAKAAGASLLQEDPEDGGEDGEATLLQGNVAGEDGESVSADQSLEEDDEEGDDDDDDDEEGDDDDDDDEDGGAEGASATETEQDKDTKAKAAGASLLQEDPEDGGEDEEATLLQGDVAGQDGESVSADESLEEDDEEEDDDDDDDEEADDDDDDDDEDGGAEGASATETEQAKDTKAKAESAPEKEATSTVEAK